MNNVYFGEKGLTSTEGNFYANLAKEMQQSAIERLNNVKFIETSVAVIGSNDKQIMSLGTKELDFIKSDLQLISEMKSFCAWVREAIKEKDKQISYVDNLNIHNWVEFMGIEEKEFPECPPSPSYPTEEDVINSWDINKRNKYLSLEACAATLGKYIHPDGVYNKARKQAHTAINNPINTEGTGRDMILYYTQESVDINSVDSLFVELQAQHREYEKELNKLKSEIKETLNNLIREINNKYQEQFDIYNVAKKDYNDFWDTLRVSFNNWKTNELEKLSKLKIIIPKELQNTFEILKEIGNTSK